MTTAIDRPRNDFQLIAHQLIRDVVSAGEAGDRRRLLDNVSLVIEPGQVVALVGGSGAGKSTLMRTLLGIEPTNSGQVQLNGHCLRENFDTYRHQIGYVPQDDIIHGDLTVEEALGYAAKLRLRPDQNHRKTIHVTLHQIGMLEHRGTLVRDLSGGQRKRISIGVELLADPQLFFLDEPTSGLDPGLDKKLMQLLRQLADQGRTIVLVTHATSNIHLCDRVAFMGQGGRLCYFGPPAAAQKFFELKTPDFADIYNELARSEAIVRSWAYRYQSAPDHDTYITQRLKALQRSSSPERPDHHAPQSNFLEQIQLLSDRYSQLMLRDRVNLAIALCTAPIGILLILLAVQNHGAFILDSPMDIHTAPTALRVLFIFTCAGLWVGLSSSLQEIVKEAAIYRRERLVNLNLNAYLGSKFGVLGLLTIGQTFLMMVMIQIGFQAPTQMMFPWSIGVMITTFLTLLTSVNLGLMVSALVKNISQANSALPLLLIPQIIFSGVLFNSEGIARLLSWLTLSRWSIGAYGILTDINGLIPAAIGDGTMPQPFSPKDVYDPTFTNLLLNWLMLVLHSAIYLGLTWQLQKRKDCV
jgi:ABC transport system ATP-binding/permease protein